MWGSKEGLANLKATLADTNIRFTDNTRVSDTRVFVGGKEKSAAPVADKLDDETTETQQTPIIVPEATKSDVVGKLVLDAGAFITGFKIDSFGPTCEYYTTPEVVNELKDENARNRFNSFPYPITVKNPSDESIRFANTTSRATGDFIALSLPDRKVIALAYQLEVETHGSANLKAITRPNLAKTTTCPAKKTQTKTLDELALEPEEEQDESVVGKFAEEHVYPFSLSLLLNSKSSKDYYDALGVPTNEEGRPIFEVSEDPEEVHGSEAASAMLDGPKSSKKLLIPGFDDGTWITPSNISNLGSKLLTTKQASVATTAAQPATVNSLMPAPVSKASTASTSASNIFSSGSSVGCVTTDYAMQNVMLQCGLRVVSVHGYAITTLQQFMMGCHACYTMSRDMGRGFCAACGGYTMVKVSISVDKKGGVRYKWPTKKIFNTRGTVYNIPKFLGGKKNKDLILREEQMPKAKLRDIKAATEETNAMVSMSDQLFERGTEFAYIPTSSHHKAVFGYGRRNPNEVNRYKASKK